MIENYYMMMSPEEHTLVNYLVLRFQETRPEEKIIIALLIIAIGIGAAILINQRKIKKQLRELLDQKEDKPSGKI